LGDLREKTHRLILELLKSLGRPGDQGFPKDLHPALSGVGYIWKTGIDLPIRVCLLQEPQVTGDLVGVGETSIGDLYGVTRGLGLQEEPVPRGLGLKYSVGSSRETESVV